MNQDFKSIEILQGSASPMGANRIDGGVNFSVFSRHATKIILCLFLSDTKAPSIEIPLDLKKNKTGDIWHVFVKNLPSTFSYAYKAQGPFSPKEGLLYNEEKLLSDPYAKNLLSPKIWGEKREDCLANKATFTHDPVEIFDWENDIRPNIPMENLIIYEMHVRGFTIHSSSHVEHPGTFLGIIEKIPYLKKLGVNAIELLPIYEFDETPKIHHPLKQPRADYWGYNPINFFMPMNRYASWTTKSAVQEFKLLVKELHKHQIEVILDVVYNHTAEGSDTDCYLNFRGFDNSAYYFLGEGGDYFNFSGCGNTFNCNFYPVKQLILESLRYWVSEMHVDGFRFDLASILTRGEDAGPIPHPPLLKAIQHDPLLSKTKLIAEPWDAGGLYQLGHFPSFGHFSEWNGQYRDIVKKFVSGTSHMAGAFAKCFCGSQDLYDHWQQPYRSINFITSHDGFSLNDLVTYEQKNNFDNGEDNRDGENNNIAWNCGIEGPSDDQSIQFLRERQRKNFLLALFVSQGVPMLLMGDEYGHSKKGNNNTWCQDNELNWFLWNELEKKPLFFRFVEKLIKFRKEHKILQRNAFLKDSDIDWHGTKPFEPDWLKEDAFIACTLKDPEGFDLYIAFNAHQENREIYLPKTLDTHDWHRVIYTGLHSPDDFAEKISEKTKISSNIILLPYSSFLAKSCKSSRKETK